METPYLPGNSANTVLNNPFNSAAHAKQTCP